MKIEKVGNKYRIRKQINKQTVIISFNHKPSQAEILEALSKQANSCPAKGSFYYCANSYMQSKSHVVSPSTLKGYTSILNALPEDFRRLEVARITQMDIQEVVNDYASVHSPKSVRNIHGFISAVIKQFRPDMTINTTLPQKAVSEHYIPSEEDIKRILEASKDDPVYHVPFQLGIMGLRRSEVCALTLDDIDGNTLTINKALVQDVNNQWVIKTTKTAAGTRKIFIPDSLVEEIRKNGKIFDGYPNTLNRNLYKYQDKLGIPRFRFHTLRHFFCSYAHSKNIPDAVIMESGGWRSSETMRNIYRHAMNSNEAQKKIYGDLLSG